MATTIQRNRVKQLEYARDRESKRLLWIHQQDRRVNKEIAENMQYAMDSIMKEAQGWISGFAGKENITMSEALRLAKEADIEALARKAKVYVKNKDFSDLANDEMRLYNFSMKMSRHDLLLRNMDLELIKAFSENEKVLSGHMVSMSTAELVRQSGILGLTIGTSEEIKTRAKMIADESFHMAHFSDRIWDNQKELSKLLQNGLIKSNLMGQHPTRWMSEMRNNLTEAFSGSTYALKRLAVTESARVQIASQKAAYETGGYEWFEFIAEPTACNICLAFDGKIAEVKNMMIGGNAPPIHPRCKCSTAASMGPKEDSDPDKKSAHLKENLVSDIEKSSEKDYNNLLPLNLQFFADKKSDKEKLLEKFSNNKLPKGRFNKNKRLFDDAFRGGIESKVGTVTPEVDVIYHVANRHPRLAYRSDFTQLMKQTVLNPETIIETVDKNGALGVSYVDTKNGFAPIIVITRGGKIVSAYDTNNKYINGQIKKGKVIYDGSKS